MLMKTWWHVMSGQVEKTIITDAKKLYIYLN
jgi:hypothetical protein